MKKGKVERQQKALARLEAQLKSGKKPEKIDGKTTDKMVDLNEGQIKRITNRIKRLKEKIA